MFEKFAKLEMSISAIVEDHQNHKISLLKTKEIMLISHYKFFSIIEYKLDHQSLQEDRKKFLNEILHNELENLHR